MRNRVKSSNPDAIRIVGNCLSDLLHSCKKKILTQDVGFRSIGATIMSDLCNLEVSGKLPDQRQQIIDYIRSEAQVYERQSRGAKRVGEQRKLLDRALTLRAVANTIERAKIV